MKRGFKAEAERISLEVRAELKLEIDERLDPLQLATYLAIPVYTLAQAARVSATASFVAYFSSIEPDVFSAATIFQDQYRRLIIHNEHQHPNRQASNLAHEISHTLLEHQATALINSDGQRYWNADVEAEATWLGAALLLPRDGALRMAKEGLSIAEIAIRYGVSDTLCRWRINDSGIAEQVRRWKRWEVSA